MAVVEERVDHVDHAVDRLGGAGLGERRTRAERLHVGAEAGQLGLGQLEVGHAELAGLGEDGVVDVGDVAHHAHLVTELLEPADEEVVGEVGGGVAEVRGVVRRDAADVHAHDRADLERDDGTLRGVEEPDGHGAVTVESVTVWGCGGVRSPSIRSEPSPLWRRLTVSSAAEKVSMPDRVLERAGVEGAQVGDAVDEVEHDGAGGLLVADDQDVAGERGGRGRRAPPQGRGGTRRRRGRRARRPWTSAAIEPAGDTTGTNWRPSLHEAVRHRDHDLARELVGVGVRRGARRRPRRWRARPGRRRRRRGWCRARGRRPGRPTAPAGRRRRSAARSRSRDPTTTSWPAAARRAAMPAPRRSRSPQHTDLHHPSFAHPRPRSPPARPLPEHPAERVRMRHRSDGWWGRRLVVVPPRHRASHAERPHRTHRTPPARPRHQPPGTRRRLRAAAGASASRPEARTRSPRCLPGCRCPAHLATVTPGRMSRPPERLRVVPVGGRALGPGGLPARRRRDHGAGIQPRSARGRHRPREHRLRASPPRHRGRHSRRLRRPDPVRSHRGRPAMDDRARGRRGLAAQDRRPQDPRARRPRPRGSRAIALHRHARDPRAPGSGLPPRRERSRAADRQAARTRRPAGARRCSIECAGAQDAIASTSAIRSSRSRSSSTVGSTIRAARPSTTTGPVATTSFSSGSTFSASRHDRAISRSSTRCGRPDSSIRQLTVRRRQRSDDVRGRGRGQVMQSAPRRMRSSA